MDIRVVDLSTGIAGAYATRLFAVAGADVIKVERPDGDPLRSSGALFEFLHQSKRSVVADGAPPDLIQSADLVVSPDDVPGANVLLSITPYGRGGPWSSGHPSTDFTIQAESGSIAMRGHVGRPPVQMGGRLVEWTSGAFGAALALAAVLRSRHTGQGDRVDVSMLECSALITNLFMDVNHSLSGSPDINAPPGRGPELPSIEPTADGWVGFNTNAAQQFQDFLVLIERDDLLRDEEFMSPRGRALRRGEIRESMLAWTKARTTDEIVERAALFRIPVAPVGNGRTLPENEHLVARGFYVDDPTGRFKQPQPPFLLDGARLPDPRPAPSLGEHTGRVEARSRGTSSIHFEGLRVIDATCWWAGPAATQVLAYLGADVIHLESVQRPDAMRTTLGMLHFNKERWWEYSSFFLSFNQNKRDVTLNLADPRGVDIAKRMIAGADVLVENYSPRVFEQFGLDWDAVREINPNIVMLRLPAFGLDGPWRDRVAFAQTVEQFSGLAWVTGHPEDPPIIPRGPGDPIAGMHAAFALQIALIESARTCRGVFVEMPLCEAALNVAAEQVIEWTANGRLLERRGNDSPDALIQGLYECASHKRGGERWLAVSAVTGAQADALRQIAGEEIAEWASTQDVCEAVDALLAAGVPAAELADPRLVHANPQIAARGFFEEVEHPVVGTHAFPTLPARMQSVPRWTRTPAPTLGQHNTEVLRELGLSDDEIAALARDKVIGESL